MSEAFNPYREWLDLDVASQPSSDYELFRLRDFENDQPSILAAADRAIARVRGFRPGANASAWSKLLDDLNAAKRRLGDSAQKARYDEELKAQRAGGAAPVAPAATSPTPAAATDNRYPP
ncbi:MAG TPA: hypothetical protein VL096_10610, partial [Pirellulaceae bacterium]|nr:hypothetical protein [Pirellulaceae bacterium]